MRRNLYMAWVYGIQSGLFIKIGWAHNVADRLRTMNLYNPHPCKVVMRRHVEDYGWIEKRMHRVLAPYSVGREWFLCDAALVRAAMDVVMQEARDMRRVRRENEDAPAKRKIRLAGGRDVEFTQAKN